MIPPKSRTERNQYFSAIVVNLISLSHGCAIGWLSPVLLYLFSSDSHLKSGAITYEQASWIGSLSFAGSLVGVILYGYLNEIIGKKMSLLLLVPPHLSFWGIVYVATDVRHLYIARFLGGLTGGGTIRTVSLFIAEMAENRIRGTLGSLLILFMNFGILLSFTAAIFLNYHTMPIVMAIIPILYFFLVLFLPDTPQSLIKRNRLKDASHSLMFYRTSKKVNSQIPFCVKLEFEVLRKSMEIPSQKLNESHRNEVMKNYMDRDAIKGISIGFFLMWLSQFSGCFALINYTANIFKESGSMMTPQESSIIVAFISLLGSYVATFLVDRCGRKKLMIISTSFASLGYVILATYSYLKEIKFDVSHLQWIPIVTLSLIIFVGSLGVLTLPFVILPEVVPQNIRGTVSTICLAAVTFFAFLIIKIFPILVAKLNIAGTMWVFSMICSISSLIVIGFLPETKGKSLLI